MRLNPFKVVGLRARIHHEHERALRESVDKQVILYAALVVAKQPVSTLPHLHVGDVTTQQHLQVFEHRDAGEMELPHVAGVKKRGARAGGFVLFKNAGILNGHCEATKRCHARTIGKMRLKQWGFQRVAHGLGDKPVVEV